ILRPLLALSLRHAIDSGEGISRRPPAPLERVSCPDLFSPPDLVLDGRKRRSPVALSLLRSLRWCLQPRFPLWVTGILVAVEKSGEGVGVEVVPRRFGEAVVYFPRQRVHWRFFYSVARAGLCACCVVARGLWFRRVTGRRASFLPCRLWLGDLSFIDCPLFLQTLPVFWCPSCPPGSLSFSEVF
ncbi:unnamed protein product, partial [Brassica oleracea var. botrytis]